MNRKPEKIIGMIGSILATILMAGAMYIVVTITADPSRYDDIGIHFTSGDIQSLYFMYVPALIASIASILAAWRVDKNTKISGIVMIISAIIIVFANLLNIVSFVLLMISGVMSLARTPKHHTK